MLSLEGFIIREAKTLTSDQAILEKDNIDIVLCDVKLPDGNGVDFIKQIKAINKSIEVILLTSYGNIEDGVQAVRNGAFDYITKARAKKYLHRPFTLLPFFIHPHRKEIGHKHYTHTPGKRNP